MRRSLPITTLILLCMACAGHVQVNTRPSVSNGAAAGTPAPAETPVAASAAPLTEPVKPLRIDSVPISALPTPKDSAADAAALDLLARNAPSDALPDVPLGTTAASDLALTAFADQPRVQFYVDFFTGKARDRFQIWLTRMARHEDYARQQMSARGLPGDLVYLGLIESGFSAEAVSRAKAVGMWQFMAGTGKGYGLRIDTWVDERRDPIRSTDAAAHYLADLTDRFGSHYLAAAAYNAGAGKVERGLGKIATGPSKSEAPDPTSDDAFFSLADTKLIRDETKNYVPQLIASALIAKEPQKYGFAPVVGVAPFPRDSVMVDGGTGLDLIARLADTTLDALRELNPHLLRAVTPPGESYPVRVPAGMVDKVMAAYASMPASERTAIAVHKVKSGETVTTIAKKYHVAVDAIRTMNRSVRGTRKAVPGSTLYIPVSTVIPIALMREPDPPVTTRTRTRTYVVKAGETLAGIAKRNGVTVASLGAANKLSSTARLQAGQKLQIRTTIKRAG